VNEQLYKADCETRELKQRIAVSEREDREREDQKAREWRTLVRTWPRNLSTCRVNSLRRRSSSRRWNKSFGISCPRSEMQRMMSEGS